ncbi:hypothetical protein TcasGA2_TC016193 [Tribolium castaneum]|uniref:Uncharacterized protein n=1 Tax=Tribolium castaneum TaxID=7070 RepID=D6X4T0_TRICA|nr:hypothetical protein TcasGA2_TC016193 [Tribolium castaneum]
MGGWVWERKRQKECLMWAGKLRYPEHVQLEDKDERQQDTLLGFSERPRKELVLSPTIRTL